MSARPLAPPPRTYAQLRAAVTAVVIEGRSAIDRAWLETYHETGRLIHEHILLFRDRANYGAKTFEKLAEDTGIHRRTLQECVQFYRCFPIWRARAKLGWTHYRLLIQVADPAQRKALEARAIKQEWTSPQLETHVRSFNAHALAAPKDDSTHAEEKPVELLKPRCGIPGLRRIVERPPSTSLRAGPSTSLKAGPSTLLRAGDGLGIDLGFKNYAALPAASAAKLKLGDIVEYVVDPARSTELRAGPDIRVVDASPNQLFTYRATILKIVDGDTLDIALALAPGFTRDLRLRLRGLDCPELATAAGRAAKAFVEKLLSPGDEVIVCTTKPDKYDRYLADVFIGESRAESSESRDRNSGAQLSALSSQLGAPGTVFLNNELLRAGHAFRYDGGGKEK